jgi:hypothetical protein
LAHAKSERFYIQTVTCSMARESDMPITHRTFINRNFLSNDHMSFRHNFFASYIAHFEHYRNWILFCLSLEPNLLRIIISLFHRCLPLFFTGKGTTSASFHFESERIGLMISGWTTSTTNYRRKRHPISTQDLRR